MGGTGCSSPHSLPTRVTASLQVSPHPEHCGRCLQLVCLPGLLHSSAGALQAPSLLKSAPHSVVGTAAGVHPRHLQHAQDVHPGTHPQGRHPAAGGCLCRSASRAALRPASQLCVPQVRALAGCCLSLVLEMQLAAPEYDLPTTFTATTLNSMVSVQMAAPAFELHANHASQK